MSTSDPPQTPSSRDFPVEWYDSAPEDHFWMIWRLKVILRHLRRLKIDDRAALRQPDIRIITVPAMPATYSKYDRAVGHMRRHTRNRLRSEISAAGLEIDSITYRGLSLVPLALLRKVAVVFTKPDAVIRRGIVPPSAVIDKFFRLVMTAELAIAQDVPYGTSLLAVAREASP
jgi:hypothetical protein